MNLDQIARATRQELDAFRADGTTSDLWSNEEVYAAVNAALEEAYRILRMSKSHHVRKVLNSDDSAAGTASLYGLRSYSPSSLSIVAGTSVYTLPPDFVSLISLVPKVTTDDTVGLIRFRPAEPNDSAWEDAETTPSDDTPALQNADDVYYFVFVGRSLYISPTPLTSFEVTLTYNYRPNKLRRTATGTITTTSTAVTGSSTVWLSTAQIRLPAEIIPGTSGSATVPTPDVNAQYPTVTAISSDTACTLSDALSANLSAGTGHIMAMVPLLPEEHHMWLASYAAAYLRRKTNIDQSDKSKMALISQLSGQIQPETREPQQMQSAVVEDFAP